eukprot:Amastigsp_a679205_15.p2 type:complete len:157 gc:universal Amastigsp_a679205_15:368-838(+)
MPRLRTPHASPAFKTPSSKCLEATRLLSASAGCGSRGARSNASPLPALCSGTPAFCSRTRPPAPSTQRPSTRSHTSKLPWALGAPRWSSRIGSRLWSTRTPSSCSTTAQSQRPARTQSSLLSAVSTRKCGRGKPKARVHTHAVVTAAPPQHLRRGC